jgi:type I restriction enzyme S subunit
MTPPGLAIRPAEWEIVREILDKHVPQREVWAFGSRVAPTSKPFSDLDLTILGEQPLTLSLLGELSDAFTASDLPFKVDIVDWATASATFRKIIMDGHVVLQAGSGGPSWS